MSTQKSTNIIHSQGIWPINYLEIILFAIFIPLMLRYQVELLTYLDWGDETASIVTAKMMASGKKLFSEIHELHGPLSYLPGILTEQFGDFGVKGHRVPILLLQWVALAAIYFSPIGPSKILRIVYCIICGTIIAIYLPDLFGHTYIFQVLAGLMLIIILSQYTLPAILKPHTLKNRQVVLGNILIVSLPFLAFTYIPISIALLISSFRRQYKRTIIWSSIIGVAANILFLVSFGSIPGFIALHFWINLAVSREFIEGEALGLRYVFIAALKSVTSDLSRFGIFILISAAITSIARNEKGLPWRSAALGLGIASLLVRSMGFQGLPLIYLSLSIPLVFFSQHPRKEKNSDLFDVIVLMPVVIICFIKLALLSPANIPERKTLTSSTFSELTKKITTKEDRVIAWPFKNDEYVLAERLPASGNFFYLPWQGKYYEDPLLGMKIDSCKEIIANKPKIIFIEKYSFGGVAWEDYSQECIEKILGENYIKTQGKDFYIRKDIYEKNRSVIQSLTEK